MVVEDFLQEVRDGVWDEEIRHANQHKHDRGKFFRSACAGHNTQNMSVVYVSSRVRITGLMLFVVDFVRIQFFCWTKMTNFRRNVFVNKRTANREFLPIDCSYNHCFGSKAITCDYSCLWWTRSCVPHGQESARQCAFERLCRFRIWTQNKCATNDLGGR